MSKSIHNLATTIATREVPQGSVALYWLCQAGFAFKSSGGQIVYIDPYLSDELVAPRVVIPMHFWMFVEQNGDPGKFLQFCAERAPAVQAILMKPGGELLFRAPA